VAPYADNDVSAPFAFGLESVSILMDFSAGFRDYSTKSIGGQTICKTRW